MQTRVKILLAGFAANKSGATVIEYGLIATLIAVACIASFNALGGANGGGWSGMANKVIAAMNK